MLRPILLVLIVVIVSSCQQRPKKNSAFYVNVTTEPSKLNPVGSSDGGTSAVKAYLYESLLTQNIDTFEWESRMAESWVVSPDKMKFTFNLRKGIKWHDGVEFTAKDVKFSYDIMFMDKFNTIANRPYYEGLKEVKIIDDYTVEIIAKDKNWQNFDIAATMDIFPEHFYMQEKKKSFFNKNLNGSGPYIFDYYSKGSRLVLRQNPDWWGRKVEHLKESYAFEKIVLRFAKTPTIQLEMLKKGSLDFVGMNPDMYVKQAVGDEWGKSVHKVLTKNKSPKGYNFIGWNLEHPILSDKRVRKSLYHLVNRDIMVEKFEYGYSVPANGPIYPASPYTDPKLSPLEYDPKLALRTLKAAGWSDTDGDNILDKVINGRKTKLSITILEPYEPFMKYLTIFKEDAKKAGVEINIKLMEWNSFLTLLNEKKFDAFRMAWSVAIDWNPIQIWHSKSAKGGSNFISFSNPDADRLMTEAKFIHDRAERIELLRKVEKIIIDEHPYVWFTYKPRTMYGHTERMKKEKDTYNYGIGAAKFWKFKSVMRKDI